MQEVKGEYREGDSAAVEKEGEDSDIDTVFLVVKLKGGGTEVVTKFPGLDSYRKPSETEVRDMLRSCYDDILVHQTGKAAAMQFAQSTAEAMKRMKDAQQEKQRIIVPGRGQNR